MDATTLQALRRLLHYSAEEAARDIPADAERPHGVEVRTWHRWESGQRPIPPNVRGRVLELTTWRTQRLEQLRDAAQAAAPGPLVVVWYIDRDDWTGGATGCDGGVLWRPEQSAAAAALAELGLDRVRLVPFDARAYNVWRRAQGIADGPQTRQRWAELAAAADPSQARSGPADPPSRPDQAPLAPIKGSESTPSTNQGVSPSTNLDAATPSTNLESSVNAVPLGIVIPDGIAFADLKLQRDPVTLEVEFDLQPIEAICRASGVPLEVFTQTEEDNLGGLIVGWYRHHRASGGTPDPVAEQIIAEVEAESRAGGAIAVISHGGSVQ